MQATTELNQIEIIANGAAKGVIQLRFSLSVQNNGVIISQQNHRTSLPPGHDIDAQLSAVSAHVMSMGFPAVSQADIDSVKAQASAVWTPDIVAAYQSLVQA